MLKRTLFRTEPCQECQANKDQEKTDEANRDKDSRWKLLMLVRDEEIDEDEDQSKYENDEAPHKYHSWLIVDKI